MALFDVARGGADAGGPAVGFLGLVDAELDGHGDVVLEMFFQLPGVPVAAQHGEADFVEGGERVAPLFHLEPLLEPVLGTGVFTWDWSGERLERKLARAGLLVLSSNSKSLASTPSLGRGHGSFQA